MHIYEGSVVLVQEGSTVRVSGVFVGEGHEGRAAEHRRGSSCWTGRKLKGVWSPFTR